MTALPYPLAPGHRGTDTSAQAAEQVLGKAKLLRRRLLVLVRQAPQHDAGVLLPGRKPVVKNTPALNAAGRSVGLTVREAAELLGEDNDNVNPRMSELRAAGMVRDSGVRRMNRHSGKLAVAWVPGDDPGKPQALRDNAPPTKPALLEAYRRGMAAAYHLAAAEEEPTGGAGVGAAALAVRRRLRELEPGNTEWAD